MQYHQKNTQYFRGERSHRSQNEYHNGIGSLANAALSVWMAVRCLVTSYSVTDAWPDYLVSEQNLEIFRVGLRNNRCSARQTNPDGLLQELLMIMHYSEAATIVKFNSVTASSDRVQ